MKYESGEVEPSVEIVRRLSKLFNVSSPSPVYSATRTYNVEQTNKLLESLSFEQQQIVFSLINSLAKINNQPQTKVKRTPSGLNGKFIMSEDFDEPLDDFKEYM